MGVFFWSHHADADHDDDDDNVCFMCLYNETQHEKQLTNNNDNDSKKNIRANRQSFGTDLQVNHINNVKRFD